MKERVELILFVDDALPPTLGRGDFAQSARTQARDLIRQEVQDARAVPQLVQGHDQLVPLDEQVGIVRARRSLANPQHLLSQL